MRRPTPALLVLSLAATLTACSGGDAGGTAAPSAAASESASPSPSPSPLPSPVDVKVAGVAAADKINLQAADLPAGFMTSPASSVESPEDVAADKAVSACVGVPFVEPAVRKPSDDFVKGFGGPALQYASLVEFYADEATVASDLAVAQGEKIGPCLAAQFKKELSASAPGVRFTPIEVTRLSPAAPGTDGAFGLRFATKGRVSGQMVPFAFDVLGFAKDRTEVSFVTVAAGTDPNDAERDALFAKLVERGVANAL